MNYKYKIGDKLEDMKDAGKIEIVGSDEFGYDINVDGIKWEYGVSEPYLDNNCRLINRTVVGSQCEGCHRYHKPHNKCTRIGMLGKNKGYMGVCWISDTEGEY